MQMQEQQEWAFWHFQHADSTVLDPDEVKEIRSNLKKIWQGMCDRFGPIGVLWTTISPTWQLKFYVKIEAKYPLLWLCENHYKADTIAFSDYSHWYDKQYLDNSDDNDSDDEDKDKDPKPKPKPKSKPKSKPKPTPIRNRS
jgi:hypothetical protein